MKFIKFSVFMGDSTLKSYPDDITDEQINADYIKWMQDTNSGSVIVLNKVMKVYFYAFPANRPAIQETKYFLSTDSLGAIEKSLSEWSKTLKDVVESQSTNYSYHIFGIEKGGESELEEEHL